MNPLFTFPVDLRDYAPARERFNQEIPATTVHNRTYFFPNDEVVEVEDVDSISKTDSGITHLGLGNGLTLIVNSGWLACLVGEAPLEEEEDFDPYGDITDEEKDLLDDFGAW